MYDIEFKVGAVKHTAAYADDGTLDYWEKEIAVKDLPADGKLTVAATDAANNVEKLPHALRIKSGLSRVGK